MKKPKIMNLPNKITLIRVSMIPFFVYFYLSPSWDGWLGQFIAAAIFSAASATDALDGYIARRRKLITNFGKLMDPLADKLLVSAALIAMVAAGDLSAWVTVVLISREFFVSGVRQLALEQDIVMAASFWAKVKTVIHMIMIIYILVPFPECILPPAVMRTADILGWLLVAASVIFSVLSAVEYAAKNKQVFK
jgi:CDP-diacylglycerol--glycerol-3-phosphate 3-phosphatidyltransferase